ncbi:TITAN-like protein isoform X2 [Cajanus cajan]|uniref:TITAN-like protein isoform X2 n=1 Tax=Cajanus cajan TaxID=3821 RepID=UPI00098DC136|nr:TITAN-like protein isoform X2 [Cajanus cajan]
MEEQHDSENARVGTTKQKKKAEYEFCKACNINHNQGLRHKYFPNHKKSLSTFLSRFRNKLSDVRFFLNAPIPLDSQLASRNRIWCVFCDQDIEEHSSSFACANAIRHLSSAEHVKNLKHFFWKYGAAADQLDAFMVSDDDVAKWEKRCVARKDEASEGCRGKVFGPSSDDIHNQVHSGNVDSLENVYSHSVKSYPSNAVLPLQCYTNESQISCSGLSGVANVATSSEASSAAIPFALQDFAVERRNHSLPCDGRQRSSDGYSCNKQVHNNGRMVSGGSSHQGLPLLIPISSGHTESAGGNLHSGAPPPWVEATEVVQIYSKPVLGDPVSHSNKLGKSKKLNPKRVGAAWAEKRKIEMEKKKRGETVRNEYDANWLPNFGRVWQSGSRRESRKEFEREKQKLNVETQSEMPIKIQPYVSKRMRMDSGGDFASG